MYVCKIIGNVWKNKEEKIIITCSNFRHGQNSQCPILTLKLKMNIGTEKLYLLDVVKIFRLHQGRPRSRIRDS